MTFNEFDVNLRFGIVGAFIGALIGRLDGLLIALIIFMVIDYLTGVIAAIIKRELNSAIGYKGLLKKAAMLLVVILGNTIDTKVLQSGSVARTAVILFYLSNETISILENYNEMGLPFPEKLKKILEKLNENDIIE